MSPVTPPLKIIAHRGASGSAPENTLPALEHALEIGLSWVEVDVQRTRDGVLVLVHDETWQRTTGREEAIGELDWQQVLQLDAGAWFSPQFSGTSPVSLKRALELAERGMRFNLEIKSPQRHPGLAEEVAAVVRDAGLQECVVLTSFDHASIRALAGSGLRLGLLSDASLAPVCRADWVQSLAWRWVWEHPDYVLQKQPADEIWVWTLDDPQKGHRLASLGVTGIITNHPERFLEDSSICSSFSIL